MAPAQNRVFWLFHLGLSVVLPPSWSSPAATDGYIPTAVYGHLLTPATRKPPLRSKAYRHGPISKLGDDLLLAILIRLPNARSAFQCKSVCKRWCSLISSPHFGRIFVSHRQQSRIDGGGGELLPLTSRDTESILRFLPVPDEVRSNFVLLGCFKDLVLCGFVDSTAGNDLDGEMGRLFFVCNPFTKQWVALPLAPKKSVEYQNKCLVSENLDSGDDDDCRFRVVLVSGSPDRAIVDLFCSESGEWMEDAMAPPDSGSSTQMMLGDVIPLWNGTLCWLSDDMLAFCVWNPFCPHTLPTSIVESPNSRSYSWFSSALPKRTIWVSLGVLHIVFHLEEIHCLSIWRWEEDNRRWCFLYTGFVADYIIDREYVQFKGLKAHDVVGIHPSKPETIFLECRRPSDVAPIVVECNMRTGEMEVFTDRWNWGALFQPRFTCWPSPIPGHEKLRTMYDGCYSCLVQSISQS
ncbi:unnamed protein product [Linum trigynum]|uniref:F-box domain-containing protein n=1 Tax=Linum trigynum TaxID=586398 RepID=A0AAV2GJ12_9ROSI